MKTLTRPQATNRAATRAPTRGLTLTTLMLLLAAAAAVRIFTLPGVGSLSFDEAWSVYVARQPLAGGLALILTDKHPPVFYILLHFWIRLAGESEFALRLFSALLSVAAVGLVYALGRAMLDRRAGLLAAMLMAASPFQMLYAQDARMYPLAQVFLLLSMLLLWRARSAQTRRGAWWAAYGLVTLLLALTHYVAGLVVAAQAVFLLGDAFLPRPDPAARAQPRAALKGWLLIMLVLALLSSPWLPRLWNQLQSGSLTPAWIASLLGVPSLKDLALLFVRDFLIPFPEYPRLVRLAVYAGVVLLTALSLARIESRPHKLSVHWQAAITLCALSLAIPAALVWLVSQRSPMFVTRYFLPYTGLLYLLLARGMLSLPWRALRYALAVIALVVLSWGTLQIAGVARERDWRGMSTYIMNNWQTDDAVIITPPANWFIFDYYARGSIRPDLDFMSKFYPAYPQAASDEQLAAALTAKSLLYRRLWWIDERAGGVAADWTADSPAHLVTFLNANFSAQPVPQAFTDSRGSLLLFNLAPP